MGCEECVLKIHFLMFTRRVHYPLSLKKFQLWQNVDNALMHGLGLRKRGNETSLKPVNRAMKIAQKLKQRNIHICLNYQPTWAAACRPRQIYLHLERVDYVMQGTYRG